MSILSKKRKRSKATEQNKVTAHQHFIDILLQLIWALGLIVTFALVIIKLVYPNRIQSARVDYLIVTLVVFLIIPYLTKLEAFGIKIETRKRVDEVEIKVDAIDARLKALPDYILGSDYYSEDDFQLAKESFHRSLKADPTFWPAEFCLGSIHQDEKRYEDAIRTYKKILESDPDNIYTLNNLAESYLYSPPPLRNPERALQCAEKILSKLDGMGSALLYKCEALNRLNKNDEASEILKQLLDRDVIPKQKHWVLYELALANSKKGFHFTPKEVTRMYEIALNNNEGEYFLEMAKEEADLFENEDKQTILKFVEDHKEAEASLNRVC